MSRKYTYEEVKKEFERRGYKLLSKEYKNAREKLEYICPKGHHGTTIFHTFKRET